MEEVNTLVISTNTHRLFGTDGVRGIVNEWLTPENALRLGLAIGSYLSRDCRVLVGCDGRAGNAFLVNSVISGLLSAGVKVFFAGFTPTPALQLYVKSHGFDAGIMVTASHNPPEYSGLKLVLSDGVEATRDVEEAVEELYHELTFRRVSWTESGYGVTKVDDVNDFYVEKILDHVDVERIAQKKFKVVVDCANNVGSLTTPKLLRRLGCKVLTVNCDISHIPYRNPEPSSENLGELSNIIKSLGADLGVAHDGDADRAVFIDGLGRFIPGDRTAIILCEHILSNKGLDIPKKVVTAISSSTLISEMLSKYGVEVIWTKVGSINIARTMIREGSLLGFEENGGFLYGRHQYVRDGAMATALMLECLSFNNVGLHELYNKIPQTYLIKTKVTIDPRAKDEIMGMLKQKLVEVFASDKIVDIDGVKVISTDYWFLVRPSGTEPIIRIFIEAKDGALANKLLNTIVTLTDEVIKK
ncbi:MAG: phosphoglucosamine mutase [Sulfolobales archaeon]